MVLAHLSLTNFRNFSRLDIEIPTGIILLVGDNAQGKTSFLESIFFLSSMASFQADSDRELINFLAGREPLAVARLVGDYKKHHETHRLEVRIIQESSSSNGVMRTRKEVLLDGVKLKVGEVIGLFNAVLFLPQMLQVVEGAPEDRRRYINLILAQAIPGYVQTLSEYNRILAQRNALLKQLSVRGGDVAQLDYWDELLASLGAHLIHCRIQAIQEIEHLAAVTHLDLTHGNEVFRLTYKPAYDPLTIPQNQYSLPIEAALDRASIPLDTIQSGFVKRLQHIRREEIDRGITTIGPHRDELRFVGNTIDLGIYGSRGQARTAILALKLAEMMWMRKKTGQWPVLLFDEVLAELDTTRRDDLLSRLMECDQLMIATTDIKLFSPEFVDKSVRWRVHAGRIFPEKTN